MNELFANPRHPYTKGLIASVPKLGSKVTTLPSILAMFRIFPLCQKAVNLHHGVNMLWTFAELGNRSLQALMGTLCKNAAAIY